MMAPCQLVPIQNVLFGSNHRCFSESAKKAAGKAAGSGQEDSDSSTPSGAVSKPKASNPSSEKSEASMVTKAGDMANRALRATISMILKSPGIIWFYLTHPKELRLKVAGWKEIAIKEANHYWMGSKLLVADVRTARHIMGRTLRGSTLSRRERKQLLRTVTDVFRLVPMSIFVLIPFMELALPFALKLFPNMLPSTFQDSLKEEEKMKGELQMRISMAGFFQE